MNLMSWSLAGLLAAEAAAPAQGGATKCELTDNRCKAELFVRRAKDAPNDQQRALYLNVAHRSYLGLFDKTGDARHLCAARRLYDRSVAIKNQPAAQRAGFENSKGDLTARERKSGVRCERPAKRLKDDPPLLAAKNEERTEASTPAGANTSGAPAEARASAANTSAEMAASSDVSAEIRPASKDVELVKPVPDRQSEGELLPVSRRLEPPSKSPVPRSGRNLVIGGGVTLGVGLVLAGVATSTGVGLLGTRRQAHELRDMVDGHATDEQLAQDAALRREYERLAPPTLALALTGGVSAVVGAVLLGVGGHRMARRPSQTAVFPVPGGVAFRARF